MKINIPFYVNPDDKRCLQVAMKCVLKYFLDEGYSFEELDKLTGRKGSFGTYTSQIAPVLYDLGLNVKYFSNEALEPYLQGEPFIRKHYGKDAEKILEITDIPVMINSIKKLLKYNIFEKKKLSLKEMEEHIRKGRVPLVMIDHNKIISKEGFYQGHFVVMTGFDEKNIFYHESGPFNPEANKKISKKIFEKAMNANGTDNDVIIVFGKRNKER
jgi:hypothetical protein